LEKCTINKLIQSW